MVKFSKIGADILKTNYKRVVTQFRDAQFHAAPSVEKAYLTDMIQELIEKRYSIINVDIKDEWIEMDTAEDIENAREQWA